MVSPWHWSRPTPSSPCTRWAGCCRCGGRDRGLPPVLLPAGPTRRRASEVSVVNADLRKNVTGVRIAQARREELSYDPLRQAARTPPPLPAAGAALHRALLPIRGVPVRHRVAVVLGAGGAMILSGEITAGVLTAFLLYLTTIHLAVQRLSRVFDGYQQARVGLNRIAELLRTPTSVPACRSTSPRCRSGSTRYGGLDHVTFS
ncbi:ABC transporter ATP-binding protein [Pseudonocardia sp. MCCB 268]|nr:ABC transporter ATP-binding protein [Pseudonocardia cytotoxica]